MDETTPQTGVPMPLRVARVLASIVACLVAVVVLNMVLSYALFPYGDEAEIKWEQYRSFSDRTIDTVIVGSSYAGQGIDPAMLDDTLGSATYSLTTAAQPRIASLVAIRDAYEEHHIKRAIIGLSIKSMYDANDWVPYGIAFVAAESKGQSLVHAAQTYLQVTLANQYTRTANGLAALAPWSVYHVGLSPATIMQNIKLKQTYSAVEWGREKGTTLTEAGYVPVGGHFNSRKVAVSAAAATPAESAPTEEALRQYLDICDYCTAHDIKLYVVAIPLCDYALLRYENEGGYATAIAPFVDAMTEAGATFLDFGLSRPEYYWPLPNEIRDEQHINDVGAARFSSYLGEVMAAVERGEDVSGRFYPHTVEGWQEYLSTVESIAVATFYPTVRAGAIDLELKAFASPSVAVSYRVSRVLEDGETEVLRDWSEEETYTYPTEGHGKVRLLVQARRSDKVNLPKARTRGCARTILY